MKSLIKFITTLLILLSILAVIGRIFFIDIGKTENYSMVPNVFPGDVFLIWTRGLLGAGDVAVCRNPEDPSSLIVGRIIGIPGDIIEIKGNHIMLNKRRVQHSYIEPATYFDTTYEEIMQYVVRQAQEKVGASLFTIAMMDSTRGRDYNPVEVPLDSFYLLGDNRNMSYDSRNFGMVPIRDCIGKAFFVLWATQDNGDFRQSARSLSWIR